MASVADGNGNFGIKDEIAAYWDVRSASFDASPGHGIGSDAERTAWLAVIADALGSLRGKRVLELACGTGEFTALLVAAEARVTGLDLSAGMMRRARPKVPQATLRLGDAEDTREAPGTYDAVVCRHLVWTLPNPSAAFADWFRVLRPGGRVLIVDGDWVRLPLLGRLARALGQTLMALLGKPSERIDWAAHEAIMRQVHFRDGLRPGPLAGLLAGAGFSGIATGSIAQIRRLQRQSAGFPRGLTVGVYADFWMVAEKAA